MGLAFFIYMLHSVSFFHGMEKAEEPSSVWKAKSSKSSSKIIKGYKYEPDNRRSRKM